MPNLRTFAIAALFALAGCVNTKSLAGPAALGDRAVEPVVSSAYDDDEPVLKDGSPSSSWEHKPDGQDDFLAE